MGRGEDGCIEASLEPIAVVQRREGEILPSRVERIRWIRELQEGESVGATLGV